MICEIHDYSILLRASVSPWFSLVVKLCSEILRFAQNDKVNSYENLFGQL